MPAARNLPSLGELGEARDLLVELCGALLELGDARLLLGDDVGRRVGHEALILELAPYLAQVVVRLRELLAETVALGADVDEARERHENTHGAEQRGRRALERLGRRQELDALESR